ncbi:MAG TPA: tripartite tricarboxylate transporter substrate binding protein [Burkholderiales bacterium]|nr:tripartite tricarboxylate transporter substrate binding protein [Burkholderiales bacterium]
MKAFFLGFLFPLLAFAQSFPTKPIRVIVPFGPGGVADITARSVAPEISKLLGQQLVIENKPSAGGVVAGQEVARAAPDGYTLLLINNGTAVSKALFKSLPYDPEKDFAMISSIGYFPLVIVADPKSPLNTVKDVIAAAKAKPGKMNVATIVIGSTQHLAAELFKSSAGIDVQIIPYKATGEVVTAAKNGDADLVFEILAPVMSHIKSGNLRAIAVTTAKRFPGLADVPTVIESGVPGYDVASWNGLAAPAKTPRPIIDRLNQAVVKAVASPEVQKRLAGLGVEGRASTPEQLREFFLSESKRWSRVVEKAKIPKQ